MNPHQNLKDNAFDLLFDLQIMFFKYMTIYKNLSCFTEIRGYLGLIVKHPPASVNSYSIYQFP